MLPTTFNSISVQYMADFIITLPYSEKSSQVNFKFWNEYEYSLQNKVRIKINHIRHFFSSFYHETFHSTQFFDCWFNFLV